MKRLTVATITLLSLLTATGNALGQAFPSKPIRVIVGFAAGGPVDVAMRAVGGDMSTRLGQPLVLDNKPGATGMIAFDMLRESPPDGYTVSPFATVTIVASILAGKAVPNPATAFTSLGYIYEAGIPFTLNPAAPHLANVRTLKDLVATARANPGKVFFSSAGAGSSGHLVGSLLAHSNGVEFIHVGHKGIAPATIDLMAGRIGFIMASVVGDQQMVQEGKLRVLATTAANRSAKYPDVPSMVEAGFPELVTTTWGGLIAPAGTPKAIADRLSMELKTSMDKQDVRRVVLTMSEPRSSTAEEFQQRYVKDYETFARVIKAANIKVE
jgi:tripartite-type tricarboxylate transporter receptor subunit TctC